MQNLGEQIKSIMVFSEVAYATGAFNGTTERATPAFPNSNIVLP